MFPLILVLSAAFLLVPRGESLGPGIVSDLAKLTQECRTRGGKMIGPKCFFIVQRDVDWYQAWTECDKLGARLAQPVTVAEWSTGTTITSVSLLPF
jgi:hypothetical protein